MIELDTTSPELEVIRADLVSSQLERALSPVSVVSVEDYGQTEPELPFLSDYQKFIHEKVATLAASAVDVDAKLETAAEVYEDETQKRLIALYRAMDARKLIDHGMVLDAEDQSERSALAFWSNTYAPTRRQIRVGLSRSVVNAENPDLVVVTDDPDIQVASAVERMTTKSVFQEILGVRTYITRPPRAF